MATELSYDARRKRDSERRRLNVLQAAGLCFAANGYKATTMQQVATEAEVSKGLLFHFFGSKQALFKAVVEDGLNQWAALSEYRAAEIDGDARQELKSLFLASFDYVERNPVLLLFGREDEGLSEAFRKQFATRNQRWRLRIQRTLKAGVQRGELRPLDARRVALVYHQLQTALVAEAASVTTAPRYDRKTIGTAIDIFVRGIEAG